MDMCWHLNFAHSLTQACGKRCWSWWAFCLSFGSRELLVAQISWYQHYHLLKGLRLRLLLANTLRLNPLSRWDYQGLKSAPKLHIFCLCHNKSPFCSSLVLVALHCVSCNLFLVPSLAMCCSFWMSVADVQLLSLCPVSCILETLCSLVPSLVSWKPWSRGHWGCCLMVLGRAFLLGRKSCNAEGSGLRLTTDIRWIPDTHYGSASPPGWVTAGICRGPKSCSALKTLVTAGCMGGHAIYCKPVADLV